MILVKIMETKCTICEEKASNKEEDYSSRNFGRIICINCQRSFNKKKKSTPEAEKLWKGLKRAGFNAYLEKWDGYKHIDIAIPSVKVNIEVDGPQHNFNKKQCLADLKRTYHSFKKGYVTLRIPNKLVKEHFNEALKFISDFLDESDNQLNDWDYNDYD